MVHKGGSFLLERNFAIGADENGDSASSSSTPSRSVFIHGKIGGNNNAIASVPIRGRNPIEGVDEGICGSIAGVNTGCT